MHVPGRCLVAALAVVSVACAHRTAAAPTLDILVDGHVPGVQADGRRGSSGMSQPNPGFRDPQPSEPWLQCSVEDGRLHVRIAHWGQVASSASCVEGKKRWTVQFREVPEWRKSLDRTVLDPGEPNELRVPSGVSQGTSFAVKAPPVESSGIVFKSVHELMLDCIPQTPTGSRVLVSWTSPDRTTEATCLVQPEAAPVFLIPFVFGPVE